MSNYHLTRSYSKSKSLRPLLLPKQSAACTTNTTAVTECFHMCTQDAPILVRPAP